MKKYICEHCGNDISKHDFFGEDVFFVTEDAPLGTENNNDEKVLSVKIKCRECKKQTIFDDNFSIAHFLNLCGLTKGNIMKKESLFCMNCNLIFSESYNDIKFSFQKDFIHNYTESITITCPDCGCEQTYTTLQYIEIFFKNNINKIIMRNNYNKINKDEIYKSIENRRKLEESSSLIKNRIENNREIVKILSQLEERLKAKIKDIEIQIDQFTENKFSRLDKIIQDLKESENIFEVFDKSLKNKIEQEVVRLHFKGGFKAKIDSIDEMRKEIDRIKHMFIEVAKDDIEMS